MHGTILNIHASSSESGELSVILGDEYRLISLKEDLLPDLSTSETPIELILLHYGDSSKVCLETVQKLKQHPETLDIPIIVVTPKISDNNELRALELGVADFIYQPISPVLLLGRISLHIRNHQNRRLLQEKNIQLEESVRLRDDIDHILRHDLKGPLNAIIKLPEFMLMEEGLDSEQRQLLKVVQRAGETMLQMINGSMDLYRMEQGRYQYKPQPFDILALIRRVVIEQREYAQRVGAEVEVLCDNVPISATAEVDVEAEELLSHSMLVNLLRNAIEASSKGDRISINVTPTLPGIILEMRNPTPVPESVHEKFFEKYVTDGKEHGTGLGTYSARLMVRTQQGQIEMESDPVSGTLIRVTLP